MSTRKAKMQPVFQSEPSPEEIRKVSDFRRGLWWLYETGIPRGESTGWAALDRHFTVRAREWTLVTGIPSHGKSAFLDNLMINLSYEKGWRWAVFSAENLPLERHAASLMAMYIGRPFGPGLRERISRSEFTWAEIFLNEYFRFVCPPEDDCSIDRVLKIATMIAEHEELHGLVLDPWNELDHARPANLTETEYISRALTRIRRWARDHETHVFIVAHPTKLQPNKTTASKEAQIYRIPTPYDVAGSAHFRNKCDNALTVWRDLEEPHSATQIHVQKIRFREVGQVGMVELYHDAATGQYYEAGRPRRILNPTNITHENLGEALQMIVGERPRGREPGEEG